MFGRTRHRSDEHAVVRTDADRYCLLCESYMMFERVSADDRPDDSGTAEWICTACGSAVFVDPYVQELRREA